MHEVKVGEITAVIKRAPGAGDGVEMLRDQTRFACLLKRFAQKRREHLVLFARGFDRPLSIGPIPVGLWVGFDVLNKSGFVDARHREHHRGTDHVFLGLLDGEGARAVGNVGITGSIDHALGQNGLSPGFALDNDTFDRIALHDRGDKHSVQHGGNARFFNQGIRNPLECLTIDGMAVGLRFLDRRAHGFGALFEFDPDPLGVDGFLVPIPGKSLNAYRSNVAAEATKALKQRYRGTGARGTECRRESSGAGAHHQHFGLVDDGRLPCGFIDFYCHVLCLASNWARPSYF